LVWVEQVLRRPEWRERSECRFAECLASPTSGERIEKAEPPQEAGPASPAGGADCDHRDAGDRDREKEKEGEPAEKAPTVPPAGSGGKHHNKAQQGDPAKNVEHHRPDPESMERVP
jgi:hypothetical protein